MAMLGQAFSPDAPGHPRSISNAAVLAYWKIVEPELEARIRRHVFFWARTGAPTRVSSAGDRSTVRHVRDPS
eukprot:9050545-Pyramimonas_sp.AAC.1